MLDALSVGQQGLKENFKKRNGESLRIPDILAAGPRGRIGTKTARTKAKEARGQARPALGSSAPFWQGKTNLHCFYFSVGNYFF